MTKIVRPFVGSAFDEMLAAEEKAIMEAEALKALAPAKLTGLDYLLIAIATTALFAGFGWAISLALALGGLS